MEKNNSIANDITKYVTVLKFYTPTCGPCKSLSAIFDQLKSENSQLIEDWILRIQEINAVEEDQWLKPMSDLLVKQYKVTTVPTVVLTLFQPSDINDPSSLPNDEPIYTKIIWLKTLDVYQEEINIFLNMLKYEND